MIEIATALIAGMALIFAAVIPVWGKRFGKQMTAMQTKLERVRGQVENSHHTNLREELDARHKETRRWFDGLRDDVTETRQDIGGIRSEMRLLRRRDDGIDERVQRVESTTNRIIKEKTP